MNEKIILDKYNELLTEIKETNTNVKNLNKFLEDEKKEKLIQQEKQTEIEKKEKETQNKEKKELEIKEKDSLKKQDEFYSDIKDIAHNTNNEVVVSTLNDVSTLMQVSIVSNGLLIGIIVISLFAKFFNRV